MNRALTRPTDQKHPKTQTRSAKNEPQTKKSRPTGRDFFSLRGYANVHTVVTRTTRCAPDRSRTCDLRYRKPALYPLSYRGVPIETITREGRGHASGRRAVSSGVSPATHPPAADVFAAHMVPSPGNGESRGRFTKCRTNRADTSSASPRGTSPAPKFDVW